MTCASHEKGRENERQGAVCAKYTLPDGTKLPLAADYLENHNR